MEETCRGEWGKARSFLILLQRATLCIATGSSTKNWVTWVVMEAATQAWLIKSLASGDQSPIFSPTLCLLNQEVKSD